MFKVFLGEELVYQAPSIEPCLSFALELHRVSNVPHHVYVFEPKDSCKVIDLELKESVK